MKFPSHTITSVVMRPSMVALLIAILPCPAHTADLLHGPGSFSVESGPVPNANKIVKIFGHTSILDGRTIWFPMEGRKVRLASIDACELPQWSYDPRQQGERSVAKPVPCGPLAKAWLKRTVGSAQVTCTGQAHDADGALLGRCTIRGRDLALEMLRVGWARAKAPAPGEYMSWQRYAMSARHGMWATYVLDMEEWRGKVGDRTLSRQPVADFNLLAERDSEISPPFEDARTRPDRTDR